jgi:hypothetical protein
MQESGQSGSAMQPPKKPVVTQSRAFLLANVAGAILYVFAASRGGWRAEGIDSTTGEPFVWFGNILPIVAIFLVINVSWTVMLARRHWSGGRLGLMAAAVWLAAIVIDFAHH